MSWWRVRDTGLERNCPVNATYGSIAGERFGRNYPLNSVVFEPTNEDAHTGDYSLKISGTSSDVAYLCWYLYYTNTASRYGFWYKPSEIYGTHDETCVCCLNDRGGYDRVKVYWNEDGTFYLWNREQGILGSAPGHPAGEWVHIGMTFFPGPSTGWCYLYINGKQEVAFDGNTASDDYYTGRSHRFGSFPADVTRNQGTPVGAFYDDIYWERGSWSDDSDAPPDHRIFDLVPNEDGDLTEWATSIPATSLYEAVNVVQTAVDRPNIKAWENDQLVSLGMQNIAVNGLSAAFQPVMVHMSSKAYPSTGEIFMGIRTDGVNRFPIYDYGDSAWDVYSVMYDTDAQYNAWTEARINAMQVLFKGSQL